MATPTSSNIFFQEGTVLERTVCMLIDRVGDLEQGAFATRAENERLRRTVDELKTQVDLLMRRAHLQDDYDLRISYYDAPSRRIKLQDVADQVVLPAVQACHQNNPNNFCMDRVRLARNGDHKTEFLVNFNPCACSAPDAPLLLLAALRDKAEAVHARVALVSLTIDEYGDEDQVLIVDKDGWEVEEEEEGSDEGMDGWLTSDGEASDGDGDYAPSLSESETLTDEELLHPPVGPHA
jgi:hypothetical protein